MKETGDRLWMYPNGMGADGRPLFEPQSAEDLAKLASGRTREAKHTHAASLQELQWRHRSSAEAHYGVKHGIRPEQLEQTGWGVILPATRADTPEAAVQREILEALQPLLDWRREQATRNHEAYFQIFQGTRGYRPGETKQNYLARLGTGPGPADPEKGVPYYLLIVASPQVIPYHVQYQLDVQYAVGRIHFDDVEDYAGYARSVVAAERGGLRLAREVAFLGVANPDDPATQLSRKLMVGPLADLIERSKAGESWTVQRYLDGDATRQTLERILGGGATPALLYTGSHGMGFPLDDKRQRRQQGALLCQDWPGPRAWNQPIPEDFYFSADHLRSDANLLGMIAFNFACFGGGTPQHDEFSKQAFAERTAIAPEAFISGLHKKMLGLPGGGALACIGHVERAWGSSFLWDTGKRRAPEPQLAVFESALTALLEGMPVGAAMDYFNQRYAELSSDLTSYLEAQEFSDGPDPYVLADAWTSHNDARGYAITGDPAVRLQVGSAADTRARDAVDVRSFGSGGAAPVQRGAPDPPRAARAHAVAARVERNGVSAMDTAYYTLTIAIHRVAESYHVELSHSDPGSQAQVAPVRGAASFDRSALLACEAIHEQYGKLLAEQLFADDAVKQRFVQVETAAQASGSFLRILVSIDPSAQELQGLRWELLRHPASGALLSTSEQVLLSRFMVSHDWRPVKLRARTELTALIAVSAPAPGKLQRMELAPVDFEGEVARIRQALAGVEVRTLGGPGSPCTLERLVDELRRGVDLLYLVSHGTFGRSTGTPALVLQDDAGEARMVNGEQLALRVGELSRGPRLVVLASCQSAGDGGQIAPAQRTTAQASLAGRLADAGVPGVIAMQGSISMATVETLMPALFTELLRDGQIDRALAVARSKVRDRDDAWMPALYTRLLGGPLWYTPGFRGDQGTEVWRRLLQPVAHGKVVPIIGPRLLETAHGGSHETALRLATHNQYPLAEHEWDDLPRVTQYLRVKESRYNVVQAYQDQLLHNVLEQHRDWLPAEEIPPANPKPKLGKLLGLVGDHLRNSPTDPHRILAELRASVYVTTNFDPLLERALKANDRMPQQLVTRWRCQANPVSADEMTVAEPTEQAPLVYHAFGAFGPSSHDGLVLTEDDYFDYLLKTAEDKLIPDEVQSALVDNSLLFLGFRLTDWHFRVLFRLMMSLPGRDRLKNYCHVAVQLDPDLQTMADAERAKVYLADYFGKEPNIEIFWGSSEEFLTALRDELARAGDLSGKTDATQESDDEWDV
jgi:hypothetical protein